MLDGCEKLMIHARDGMHKWDMCTRVYKRQREVYGSQ